MDIDQVRKLRQELERDLEAVRRVEILLNKRLAASGIKPEATGTMPKQHLEQSVALTPLTLQVIKDSAPRGLRAMEVQSALTKRGYRFTSKEAGASSVATTLKRLVKQEKIVKHDKLYSAIASGGKQEEKTRPQTEEAEESRGIRQIARRQVFEEES